MRNRKGRIVGMVLVLMLAAVSFGNDEVFAANGWEIPLNGPSTTTSQTSSSVSLSLSSGTIQTDLDAANASTNPDEAGKVLSQTATITVGNSDGYTVYVSGNTNLTGRNNSSHKIPSITTAKTLGSMSNEWGYYATLGDSEASYNPSTSFKAMTTSQQSVGTGGVTSSSVTKKLTLFYGARVTSSAAEDFYGNTVTLSVVAQPRTVTTTVTKFNGITTMQQMTSTICSNAAVNDTAQLTDTRDNKKYWVTKLLDGNCWMSQNLALDITTTNVTTATSDVSANWTTGQVTSASLTTGVANTTAMYSWKLGDFVFDAPAVAKNSACSTTSQLSSCDAEYNIKDVSKYQASTNPNFYQLTSYKGTDGTTNCTKGASTAVSSVTSGVCAQYDAHYLAGNRYQWNAAVAGTGNNVSHKSNATSSICPKGWKLPAANTNTTLSSGTFAYMLQKYGLASAHNTGTITGTSSANGYMYDIALPPLFFFRGGWMWPGGYGINGVGRDGWYMSSTAGYGTNGTNGVYFLGFSSTLSLLADDFRSYGYTIRCLVNGA